jgi:signal transduction histidine kinase
MSQPSKSQQNADMHINRAASGWVSKKNYSLFVKLTSRVAMFLRQVMYIILGGFMTYISKTKQKVNHQKAIEQSLLDLTQELERKDQELERVTAFEDKFILMASHELKTPMTTILGNAQLLLRRVSKMPELSNELAGIRTAVERINGQTHHLNTLIDEILDLSSLRAGQTNLQVSVFNLAAMFSEIVEEQQVLTGHTIKLELANAPVMLEADSKRLSQVLVNLLDNAHKYSRIETTIKFSIEQLSEDVLFKVSDSGPGILKDQQPHIFEAFYRAPAVRESTKKGLGLGLTICKEIVERHHGYIWCESALDKGSTFFVRLPLHQNEQHYATK